MSWRLKSKYKFIKKTLQIAVREVLVSQKNYIKNLLGSSLISGGLILATLVGIPNGFLPESFPAFFSRSKGEVLAVVDDSSGPIFNPNYILSDTTFRSTRDFPTAQSVQDYLDNVQSPLANYMDGSKRASDIIFEAARGVTSAHNNWAGTLITPNINPALLLTKLETEQSLLTAVGYDIYNDPDRKILKATGYGCFDGQNCFDTKKGFFNQITGAAWQLEYNFLVATDPGFSSEPYRVGKTITTLDEKQVYLSNAATAAFYKYTPHVYWGNYSVWKHITANGWGVSQQRWTKSEIDRLNQAGFGGLQLASSIQRTQTPTNISFQSIEQSLKKEYQLGEKSDEILLLQQYLRQTGYFTQDPTGLFGSVTKNALKNYLSENGMQISAETVAENRCQTLLSKSYRNSETSLDIVDLQQCLRDLGLFSFATNTGKYGTLTQTAHQKYLKNSKGSVLGAVDGSIKNTNTKAVDTNIIKLSSSDSSAGNSTNYACASLKKKFYKIGQKSPEISALQQCMTDDKVYNFRITGLYGYVTDAALVKWKRLR